MHSNAPNKHTGSNTLYGLKQSGREWNRELDLKLHKHGFTRLKADPCTYTRRAGGLEIITVWVDDLLLFATSEDLMAKMKDDIRSEWEVTDLGEPSKIVGIEITRKPGAVHSGHTGERRDAVCKSGGHATGSQRPAGT
jgi:hypothetical protein